MAITASGALYLDWRGPDGPGAFSHWWPALPVLALIARHAHGHGKASRFYGRPEPLLAQPPDDGHRDR